MKYERLMLMSKIALSGMIVVPCFGLFVIRHRRQEITDSAPVMKSFQMVLDNKGRLC